MKQWVQVFGYAEDLQLAYDYFRQNGGVTAATRFLTRYEHCVAAVTAHPKLGTIRGAWMEAKTDSELYVQHFLWGARKVLDAGWHSKHGAGS